MQGFPNAAHFDSETNPSHSAGEGTTRNESDTVIVPQLKK